MREREVLEREGLWDDKPLLGEVPVDKILAMASLSRTMTANFFCLSRC